jgi:fibro-slime domain-containing protein
MCDDGNGVDGDGCSKTCTSETGFMCSGMEQKDTTACSAGAGECLVLPITYRDFDGQNTAGGHPDFFYYGATVAGAKVTCVPNASGANLLPLQPNGTCPASDATNPCSGLVKAALGADGKPVLNTARTGGSTCACTFTDWDGTGVLTGVAGTKTCTSGAASPTYVQDVPVKVIQSEASFKQWYHDDAISVKVVDKLELAQVGATNQYQFSSSGGRTVYDDIHDIWLTSKNMAPAGAVTSLSSGFFPLEMSAKAKLCNLWGYWNAPADCIANDMKSVWQQWDPRGWNSGGAAPAAGEALGAPIRPVTGVKRNFYFTSEARYLFRFVGGETLSFFGDDDVWVFINGHLVLDLGAPHERMKGTVTLATTGASAAWAISVQSVQTGVDQPIPGAAGSGTVMGLGLEVGKTYEIAIFHADQHPRESNYQLTLSGFSTTRSVCQPRCGDGMATTTEECDDGANNNDTLYGGCTTMCKFGPFCGDTVKNGEEECDLGRMNGARYGQDGCTAGCKIPHRCGDGIIDTAFGEQCDDGMNNGVGACQASCLYKPL